MKNQKWMDCGQGTLIHPVSHEPVTTEVVELEGHGRIFEVYHYGNERDQAQRLILAAPELLAALHKCEDVIGNATLQGKLSDNAFSPAMEALIAARAALDKTR